MPEGISSHMAIDFLMMWAPIRWQRPGIIRHLLSWRSRSFEKKYVGQLAEKRIRTIHLQRNPYVYAIPWSCVVVLKIVTGLEDPCTYTQI
jgi:hypothetical protein